ncbi:MAG: hypothetical protein IJ640_01015 [Prevotella sp.]|nr:hypothetical protein [Prevotella sp.]
MKASELMRGDWIATNRDYMPLAQVEDIIGDSIITKAAEYESEEIDEQDIKPIPLTPEILEKNGFKEDSEYNGCYWRPDCSKFCFVKELEDWYFAILYKGGHICISECNYVHELQHALKLCGIEKEITL